MTSPDSPSSGRPAAGAAVAPGLGSVPEARSLTDDDLADRISELEQRLASGPGEPGHGDRKGCIRLQQQLGELQWERFRRTLDPADLDRAWLTLSGALKSFDLAGTAPADAPEMFAALCYDAALILKLRGDAGSDREALIEATALLYAADRFTPGVPRYRELLALILLQSAQRGGDPRQFDEPIDLYRWLVQSLSGADPDTRASFQCDLATADMEKFLRAQATDDSVAQVEAEGNLDEAIEVLDEAAATPEISPPVRRRAAGAYALAVSHHCTWMRRLYAGADPAKLRLLPVVVSGQLSRAQDRMRDLVRDGEQAGEMMQVLVDVLLQEWQLCRRPEALNEARTVAATAVALTGPVSRLGHPDPEQAAGAALALGRVLAACPPDARGPDLAEPTANAFRAACDGYAQIGLARVISPARQWAEWATSQARWPDAAEAYRRMEAAVPAAISAVPPGLRRLAELQPMSGAATDGTFARALAGRPAEAIERLERDRRVFHAAALGRGPATGDVRSGHAAAWSRAAQAQAAGLRVTVADLTARYPDTALVFLVPASVGGLALVAAPGQAPHAELLPELTAAATESNIGRFWSSLISRQARPSGVTTVVMGDSGIEDLTPQPQLQALTEWLWTAAMRRVIELAGHWRRIALIPTGMLVTAPLHAAWRPDPGAVTGRRHALDDAQIVYLPTASLGRPDGPGCPAGMRVLVVKDPQPCSEPALPGTSDEAAAVARSFRDVTSLSGDEATREHVLAALPGYDIAHFICHGRSDAVNPLDSHLVLSGDEHLSVADLVDRDLSTLRLAILSACESAGSSTHVPEAAISLPAALVAADAHGVVGSLWEVADADSSTLMARFYQGLLASRKGDQLVEPAEALRAAQIWMRDTTNAQKQQDMPALGRSQDAGDGSRLAALRAQARTPMLHWATFVYAGR